jgi:hypothetical protein
MPGSSFFMYPLNNINEPNNEDLLFGPWPFSSYDYMESVMNVFGWTWGKLKLLWPVFTWIYSACGYYIMWILLHYAAIYLYPEFCAPYTILGFLLSPFMVSAPHCIAMRWIISEGSNIIMAMWIGVAGVLVNKILRRAS